MLKTLCQAFVARATTLGLKGKKRDAALIDFMCGAYAALAAKDPHGDEARHLATVLGLVFTTRGYSECERIAKREEG
jgi:hypothetical protein